LSPSEACWVNAQCCSNICYRPSPGTQGRCWKPGGGLEVF
jgi:hypothetical protein